MAAPAPEIALCICTYDRYDLLPKAIESAAKQSLSPSEYEILVIDNSPDGERAEAFARGLPVLENLRYFIERTPGLSNARNVAAKLARAPLIAFMDDDAIAAPDWAAEVAIAFHQFGPQAQIVGGRVDPIWGAPRPPWLHDELLGALSIIDWGGDTRIVSKGEWMVGTNIAFRTRAILDNGGFARNLGRIGPGSVLLSNEETHLIESICERGGWLIWAPRARVAHLVDAARLDRSWFRKRLAWQAMSDFLMGADGRPANANQSWKKLLDYFNALPPTERTIRGLACDLDDPEMFLWQTKASYELARLMLAGFEGVDLG